MSLILYQTLEDRDNPEEVEEEGPFICNRDDAWLGPGYYFWDTHIELAHWWGKRNPNIQSYFICSCLAIIDKTLFDLLSGNHRLELIEAAKMFIEDEICSFDDIIVPDIIEYMIEEGTFPYKAIRALGTNSVSKNDKEHTFRLNFTFKQTYAYLDLYLPVQICLLEKRALSLQNYKVVFPDYYVA